MKRRIRNGSFGEEGLAETDRIFHNEICLFHNIPVGKTGREADMDAEGFCRGKRQRAVCLAEVECPPRICEWEYNKYIG